MELLPAQPEGWLGLLQALPVVCLQVVASAEAETVGITPVAITHLETVTQVEWAVPATEVVNKNWPPR